MSSPDVSILIPTLNGAQDLPALIRALDEQSYSGTVQRLATDSSSEDGTVALLDAAGFDVDVIERAEFGHGRTRNALAQRASGEYVVFLSQDAVPQGDRFLDLLVGAATGPEIAGATARVLAPQDADALTRRTVDEAPEAADEAREVRLAPGTTVATLSPRERAEVSRFNNVASCMRRDVLSRHPIPDVPFGEDMAWASDVLDAGYALTFAPEALVHHAHRYGAAEAYRRYQVDARSLAELHGWRVRPGVLSALKGFAYELRRDVRFAFVEQFEPLSLLRAPFLRGAQIWGQFRGSRTHGSDHSPPKEPAVQRATNTP